jgi:signal recognition particle GTPase
VTQGYCAAAESDILVCMNKRLETLLDRIPTWPQEAQDWAALALAEVEEKVRILQSLTPEDRAKLEALRDTIGRSIEKGGSYTDEEVAGYIEQLHADAEREGR